MIAASLILKIIEGIALLIISIIAALLLDGADRVVHARMQRRVGPPWLQPFYDILKLLGKENIVPRRAVRWIFMLAPWLACVLALLVFLYIPMGHIRPVLGDEGDMILILYLLGFSGVAMAMGGFASGNPIASVGAGREIQLMMSYELPLAVVVSTVAWVALKMEMGAPFCLDTFTVNSIWSEVGDAGFIGLICLALSLIMVIPGETGKGPMDIPEAKTEILDGFIIEYSGTNLALYKITFALRSTAMAAVLTSIFFPFSLGGLIGLSSGPILAIIDFVGFWLKIAIVQLIFITVMRTMFGRLKIWQASHFYLVKVAMLSFAGMILISADIMMR
jgi:formate hydrogenlyase subunit 4